MGARQEDTRIVMTRISTRAVEKPIMNMSTKLHISIECGFVFIHEIEYI